RSLTPGTIMNQTPTAAGLSINEVGGKVFAQAAKDWFQFGEDYRFALENSAELRNRRKYWQDSIAGGYSQALGRSETFVDFVAQLAHAEFREGFDILRSKNVRFGSLPVALGDMGSAGPTWLGRYRTAMEETGNHADSAF